MSRSQPSAEAMDAIHLGRALELAARGRYRVSPNPMVGAVLVRDGEVVGEGFHPHVGGPHAEVEALEAAGERARGATLYVTLEPCSHHGRTPPCVEAVLRAGVARVVACHRDPNPEVPGGGFRILEEHGIPVSTGLGARAAVRLNWRYLVATTLRRPAVTLKWAMSLDGKIATVSGESQWISSPPAREWALEKRETHDAILVGIGTALADDPRLDRRLGHAGAPNVRVVMDRRLRLSPEARMLREDGEVLVYGDRDADADRARALEQVGATVVRLASTTPSRVLEDLLERGNQSVLVEGGGEIHAAFVAEGVFDRVGVVCAPRLLGGGAAPSPVGGDGFARLDTAPALEHLEAEALGPDLLITAYRDGCLQELFESVVA